MNDLTSIEKNSNWCIRIFSIEEHSWDMLAPDDEGKYCDYELDSYDVKMANLVSDLINKLVSWKAAPERHQT